MLPRGQGFRPKLFMDCERNIYPASEKVSGTKEVSQTKRIFSYQLLLTRQKKTPIFMLRKNPNFISYAQKLWRLCIFSTNLLGILSIENGAGRSFNLLRSTAKLKLLMVSIRMSQMLTQGQKTAWRVSFWERR